MPQRLTPYIFPRFPRVRSLACPDYGCKVALFSLGDEQGGPYRYIGALNDMNDALR